MDSCDLYVAVANLLALTAKGHLVEFPSLAEHVKSRLVVFLPQVHLADDLQDLAIRWVVVSEDLLVHFQRLLQQRQRILEVSRLHIATNRQKNRPSASTKTCVTSFEHLLSEQGQDVRVVLLGDFNLGKQVAIQFQGRCKVIKRLLEVSVLEVGLAQLGVRCDQNEKILLVDVHQQFAEGQLLDAHLDHAVGVLGHRKLI